VRGIDRSLVDLAWRDLCAYPPGRVEAEAEAFLAQQPHVAAFAQSVTMNDDAAVQQAAFGLCFLLFKILERSLGQPFPEVAEGRLQSAYEETRHWLDHGPAADPASVLDTARADAVRQGTPVAAVLDRAADSPHPTLVTYILGAFYGEDAVAADYDEGVRATLFLVLRTLTSALDLGAVEA